MHTNTLAGMLADLSASRYSCRELTQSFLERIAKYDANLNSFITVDEAGALVQAEEQDLLRAKGSHGPLSGIPIAHKDIFCTKGLKTSCGSKMLDNFVAPYDATVVSRLASAGAVVLGKTNMDEFAMGSSNENSFYGPVKNPWDETRVPGGSSGGSAAAMAARMCAAATGTDTGGSIRQPAALSGVTGIKPTYGRVSRFGMIAFASSLDQGGCFAADARGAALMLSAMSGFDPLDSTSSETQVPDYTESLGERLEGLKIGIPTQFFEDGLDERIATPVRQAAKELESQGAYCVEVALPHLSLSVPTYYVVAPAEASSNLSRFDGVRFGHRCDDPKNLNDLYCRSRGEGFGVEVKRRIMTGTYALSAGYYDAYYLKAQKTRQLISQDFENAFSDVDVLLGPTTPTPAFKIGEIVDDPVTMYLNDIFTIAVNLAGLPGMSIPCGFADGLPVGMQLIGNYFSEATLLRVAHQFQLATDWHQKIAPGYA
ncbi:MAG: Asp-tRNA(Asn)/Glu-tRNA(Gln) amidotransferase subunit GatA [Pseudomonadota bacterium]